MHTAATHSPALLAIVCLTTCTSKTSSTPPSTGPLATFYLSLCLSTLLPSLLMYAPTLAVPLRRCSVTVCASPVALPLVPVNPQVPLFMLVKGHCHTDYTTWMGAFFFSVETSQCCCCCFCCCVCVVAVVRLRDLLLSCRVATPSDDHWLWHLRPILRWLLVNGTYHFNRGRGWLHHGCHCHWLAV